jgi:hypothetical protein
MEIKGETPHSARKTGELFAGKTAIASGGLQEKDVRAEVVTRECNTECEHFHAKLRLLCVEAT